MGFTENAEDRIIDCVKDYERTPRNRIKRGEAPRIVQPVKYAKVTTAIKAGSSSGPGMGQGTLMLVSYGSGGKATYSSTNQSVPLYSGASTAIAAGRIVIVAIIDGRYSVLVDFC